MERAMYSPSAGTGAALLGYFFRFLSASDSNAQ
jgi:hypothetical protein